VSTSSEPWPDARLEALRGRGDEEIDRLLEPLGGLTNDEIIELFHSFVRKQLDLDTKSWPLELITWWNTGVPAPSWVDHQKIARAVDFSERWLPELLAMYLLDSLPTAYAGAKGALVLSRISLLGEPSRLMRRVLETLLFVLRVNERGGLDPGGRGEELARKTRVFHGLVRVMITRFAVDVREAGRLGLPWDCAANGVPVNQEDLLGTLWTFAITPIQRLERAGATIPDADKDAVVHLWCVVGHLLGIEPSSSLPMSYAEAEHCWARIREHQFAESEEGKRLTGALLTRCQELVGVPGLRGLPRAAIYDHLGPEVARCVGVSEPGPIRYVVAASNQLFRISLRTPGATLLRTPLRHFLKRFVGEWLRSERSDGRPAITLPETQRRRLRPLYVSPKTRRAFPASSAVGAGSSESGSRAP
jgi:hypothetical protein